LGSGLGARRWGEDVSILPAHLIKPAMGFE
jgi:hypothetical protein